MTDLTILPGKLARREVAVPPSKSQTIRAILFASLAEGQSIVINPLSSPDAEAMIRACSAFGAEIEALSDRLIIRGIGGKIASVPAMIDAGNSGLVLRFMSVLSALGTTPIMITGDHSLCGRPMTTMIKALNALGAKATSLKNNGFPPIFIQGPLTGKETYVDGADSQPVSAFLVGGALYPQGISLTVDNPGEKPWVRVTLDWLSRLGVEIYNENYEKYRIKPSPIWKGFNYRVPGDWSQAAFLMGAALVTSSELTVTGLSPHDPQGDKKIVDILNRMGARIDIDRGRLTVKKSQIRAIEVDVNDCIDSICALAVIACFARGTTRISGAKIARSKECDRIEALSGELKKMGADIRAVEDGLIIKGKELRGAELESHHDHRMAMSLTLAALGAKGATLLRGTECVAKTYKNFFNDLKKLGAEIC